MAVSKLLHFYNTKLYPIYDNAVIWNVVLKGAFRQEWTAVCQRHGISFTEGSDRFITTYFDWASEVMASAGPDIMTVFESWSRQNAGPASNSITDLYQYYATAFEYTLIGAAAITNGSGAA